jgi:hypothetical protein
MPRGNLSTPNLLRFSSDIVLLLGKAGKGSFISRGSPAYCHPDSVASKGPPHSPPAACAHFHMLTSPE